MLDVDDWLELAVADRVTVEDAVRDALGVPLWLEERVPDCDPVWLDEGVDVGEQASFRAFTSTDAYWKVVLPDTSEKDTPPSTDSTGATGSAKPRNGTPSLKFSTGYQFKGTLGRQEIMKSRAASVSTRKDCGKFM